MQPLLNERKERRYRLFAKAPTAVVMTRSAVSNLPRQRREPTIVSYRGTAYATSRRETECTHLIGESGRIGPRVNLAPANLESVRGRCQGMATVHTAQPRVRVRDTIGIGVVDLHGKPFTIGAVKSVKHDATQVKIRSGQVAAV